MRLRKIILVILVGTVFTLLQLGSAGATIIPIGLGVDAPPTSIGGIALTPFAEGQVADYTVISSLMDPFGGTLGFTGSLEKRTVGVNWATWSHGATPDVYWTMGATSVLLTMAPNTDAFLFYAEPNPFAIYSITATDNFGDSITVTVDGFAGAYGYGFYSLDFQRIATIAISSAVDFAIGELAMSRVPDASILILLGSSLLGLGVFSRKTK